MSTPIVKLDVLKVLEKVTDTSAREVIRKEFIKLDAIRMQEPVRLLVEAKKEVEKYNKKILEIEGQIKEIKGESKLGNEDEEEVHTGLILLRQQHDNCIDTVKKEELNKKIKEEELKLSELERALHDLRLKLEEATKSNEKAKSLNASFELLNFSLQSALKAQGLTDPLLYSVNNIDTSSLRQKLSLDTNESNKENKPFVYSDTQPKFDEAKKQKEVKKSGYLSNPEALKSSLNSLGITVESQNVNSWVAKDTKGTIYNIDNKSITSNLDKDDKAGIEKMVELFKKCELNKFIAKGGKPEQFDPSKLKIKATGDASEAVLKVCAEKGIGTAHTPKSKMTIPEHPKDEELNSGQRVSAFIHK